MSLTYTQKMALGAKRATYRRRLQEVLDAVGTTAQPQSSGLAACPRCAGKIPV